MTNSPGQFNFVIWGHPFIPVVRPIGLQMSVLHLYYGVSKDAPEQVDRHGGKAEDEEDSKRLALPLHGAVLQGHERREKEETQQDVHIPGQ